MLSVENVCRSFGTRLVLDHVSFDVAGGKLTGFVGGNGAGKTTTMRIILGVLAANSGSVSIDGGPVTREVAAHFGYMPEERGLYPKMPLAEQLIYWASLHGLSKQAAAANTDRLLARLSLTERAKDPVENLSLGNQQRAQIAAALVHDPTVLVLDEPFSGLDPMAVDVVLGVLGEFAAKGAPVLFSSHQLDVVERITDDLVIIAGGQIKASGSRAALQEAYADSRYTLAADGADLAWVGAVPGATVTQLEPGAATFLADDDVAQEVLRLAVARGPVSEFGKITPPLAEVFREVIKDESDEQTVAGVA
jgi:ABC-2 type transport system ATP-binding protein